MSRIETMDTLPEMADLGLESSATREAYDEELDALLRPVPTVDTGETITTLPEKFSQDMPIIAVLSEGEVPLGVVRAESVLHVLDARNAASMPGIRALDLAVPAPSVPVGAGLKDMIQQAVSAESDVVLVVDAGGFLAGAVLAIDMLVERAASDRRDPSGEEMKPVAQLIRPSAVVDPETSVAAVAQRLAKTTSRGLVVSENGVVAGVITPLGLLRVVLPRASELSKLRASDLVDSRFVLLQGSELVNTAVDRMLAVGAVCGVVTQDGSVAGVVWPDTLLASSW